MTTGYRHENARKNRGNGTLMDTGEAKKDLPGIIVRLLLCSVLMSSTQACTPRPFFDQTTRPPAAVAAPTESPADLSVAESQPPPETAREPAQIGGIYRGTDTFVRRGAPPPRGAIRTPQGEVTLNFVDADLREVVKSILGDTLGANFVMDPQVQGTVTLQTSEPMPGTALVSVLESILAVNNAALVESGGMYKIVPADQAIRGGRLRSTLAPASQAPGAQVVVVPLRHISATEVEKMLAPFAPPGGVLRVDPRRGLVVIGGTRSEVAAMLDVIDTFDVDWLAGMSFGLFQIRSTSSKTMVDELEKVFGDQTEGPLAGVVRFVPVERLNSILVDLAPVALRRSGAHLDRAPRRRRERDAAPLRLLLREQPRRRLGGRAQPGIRAAAGPAAADRTTGPRPVAGNSGRPGWRYRRSGRLSNPPRGNNTAEPTRGRRWRHGRVAAGRRGLAVTPACRWAVAAKVCASSPTR